MDLQLDTPMDFENEINKLSVSEADRAALIDTLETSVVEFAATLTGVMQGQESTADTSAMHALFDAVVSENGIFQKRDDARVRDLCEAYRMHPVHTCVVSESKNTRNWLARQMRLELDLQRHPQAGGEYDVAVDPADDFTGQIAVVSPDSPLLKTREQVLEF